MFDDDAHHAQPAQIITDPDTVFATLDNLQTIKSGLRLCPRDYTILQVHDGLWWCVRCERVVPASELPQAAGEGTQ